MKDFLKDNKQIITFFIGFLLTYPIAMLFLVKYINFLAKFL